MENSEGISSPVSPEINEDPKATESAENFRKFITELFENNGVLTDLRAYLRGHIVNILKNTQTGSISACQKRFTQRLELSNQALNILMAEYLLRMEFSYSLSVFISEIPLGNMVFDFAGKLLNWKNEDQELKFGENDVWSVLSYLGVKCDSEHASKIVEMYKSNEQLPLLLCIIKCMPMYKEPTVKDYISNATSSKSSDTEIVERKASPYKCAHIVCCNTCQGRVQQIREKYRKSKKKLMMTVKEKNLNDINVDNFMKNIDIVEQKLINEMFEQLKDVFEEELEMVKKEEDRKMMQSLASHVTQLKQRHDEMETMYRLRENQLTSGMAARKQFLWTLARDLRGQHARVSGAMSQLAAQARRLAEKEENLKNQISDAENSLREKGEEMRNQISHELCILEEHLESMKKERDIINKEKAELEILKTLQNKDVDHTQDAADLKSHYDLLKTEFSMLKKYIDSAKEPRCVIERYTNTDLSEVVSRSSLNNQQADKSSKEDVKTPNKVVNNLKKQKNVNFSQANLDEIYRESSRERVAETYSSASSEAGDAALDVSDMQRLRDENERLRTFARQQREHIDSLTSQQTILQSQLTVASITSTNANYIDARLPTSDAGPNDARNLNFQSTDASLSVNTEARFSFGNDARIPFASTPRSIANARSPLPSEARFSFGIDPRTSLGIGTRYPIGGRSNSTDRGNDRRFSVGNPRPVSDGRLTINAGYSANDGRLQANDGRLQVNDGRLQANDDRLQVNDGRLQVNDGVLQVNDGVLHVNDGRLQANDGRLPPNDDRLPPNDGRLFTNASLPSAGTARTATLLGSATANANTFGWKKGAGEELSLFAGTQRILVPGDAIPFVGVLRDRCGEGRRHLLTQWRSLRRRVSPLGAVAKMRAPSPTHQRSKDTGVTSSTRSRSPAVVIKDKVHDKATVVCTKRDRKARQRPKFAITVDNKTNVRAVSPKTMLREVKKQLKSTPRDQNNSQPSTSRAKSPSTVLRDAKRRLRKLEKQAEAVEKSYIDFRKRQDELKVERKSFAVNDDQVVLDTNNLGLKNFVSYQNLNTNNINKTDNSNDMQNNYNAEDLVRMDYEKYFKEYQTTLNITQACCKHQNTIANVVSPIPEPYSNRDEKETPTKDEKILQNYLETPLVEFRKLYQHQNNQPRVRVREIRDNTFKLTIPSNIEKLVSNIDKEDQMKLRESKKTVELKKIRDNINQEYHLQEKPEQDIVKNPNVKEIVEVSKDSDKSNDLPKNSPRNEDNSNGDISNNSIESDKNLLRIEIDNNTTESQQQGLYLVLKSSVEESESVGIGDKNISETNQSILISPRKAPKISPSTPKSPSRARRSVSPAEAANLTRNDVFDAIFNTKMVDIDSAEIKHSLSQEPEETSEYDKDISLEADNYISRSDYENSPVSHEALKNSDDDNFWNT